MSDPIDNLPVRLTGPGKGGVGRSSYKVGAKGLKIVEELSARGCSLTTIAKALRMNIDTLRLVRQRQPEVDEAYQRGLAVEHDALTRNLRILADDGNVVANLFLLKTRHGYREGEPLEVKVSVNTGGVLVVPADMTVEQYLAQKAAEGNMIDVTPTERPAAALYPGHSIAPPEPSPDPEPEPSRPIPSGTTIAPFPGPRIRRGD
ncbi:hypothetical protein SAMN04488003_11152 [Loktanella fryxellensis]|uniref:Uncharacterized protein n=1 Tax=Loktanella fryxellensis TaxID=245187 RepID=A0A1H8ER50_9RHOB|nr:hypothetical protein [Loktanella fryxellensis]SEN21357.1 hypothetical protein SAMN04488003_11152 [Loktanella fryxellensis]